MSTDRNEGLVPEFSHASGGQRLAKTLDRRRFVIVGAGGIAASMVAPSRAASQNPVINQSGSASITSGQFCTWNAANGQSSTITITNSSKVNNLIIAINGAPNSGIIVRLNGYVQSASNGIFTIKTSSSSSNFVATGDFMGETATITNITNSQNNATANIQCSTSG